jgi:hypothetical protein
VNSRSTSDNGYEVFTSDKPEVIKNGQLQVWDYNDANILLYIVGSILTLIVLIGTIVGLVFTLIMTTIVSNNVITKTQAKLNLGIYGVTLIFVLFKARY